MVTFRISVPQPGTEPMPPAVEAQVLTAGPPGKSLFHIFLRKVLLNLKNSLKPKANQNYKLILTFLFSTIKKKAKSKITLPNFGKSSFLNN